MVKIFLDQWRFKNRELSGELRNIIYYRDVLLGGLTKVRLQQLKGGLK